MKVPQLSNELTLESNDVQSIASELARAYAHMAAFYRDQLQLPGQEADARARGLDLSSQEAAEDVARIRNRPPDQVNWFDLNRLAERDPELVAEVWSNLRMEARKELESGHRTAEALEWKGGPWARVRFLAIRDSLRQGSLPENGIEAALIDSAAEAFADYLEWTAHFHMLSGSEVESERRQVERDSRWSPPRLSMAQAIEQAAKLAERAHQRFLRTVKMLHELQRVSSTLYVTQAGQINVGSQQMNIAQPTQHVRDRDAACAPNDFDKSIEGE
jgi:hypothetical protein